MTQDFIIAALGVFVGALGVLFTGGAVVVTILLFRQSSEHGKQIDSAIAGFRQTFEAWMDARTAELTELHQQLTSTLDETRDTPRRAEIEATVKQLEAMITQAAVTKQRSFPIPMVGSRAPVVKQTISRTCTRCGHKYTVERFPGLLSESKPSCPNCGLVDPIRLEEIIATDRE